MLKKNFPSGICPQTKPLPDFLQNCLVFLRVHFSFESNDFTMLETNMGCFTLGHNVHCELKLGG